MSIKKDNYEFYRNTFDKVHASDELVRKVKNMTTTKTKTKIYTFKKVLCIAATLAVLFVVSNIVTFAATGETWVEMVTMKITYNGEEKDIEVSKTTDENGNENYAWDFELENKDGNTYEYSIDLGSDIDAIDKIEFIEDQPKLVEKDGKIYLTEPLFNLNKDITEDFADGEATVIVDLKGTDFTIDFVTVTVKGTVDDYTVDVF